ncbi:calcium-dependent phosphotriesterase [Thozetella sp. PMI_491]|nr:calcium-dependent phosphotriesterase [Thozetella sp. PMI_491]
MAVLGKAALVTVVAFAIGLQLLPTVRRFITLVQLGYGLGTHRQPVSDFPYQCRRIDHPRLHGCEDMWLSDSTRELYLACADVEGRTQWNPSINRYNLSAYGSRRDGFVVLNVDQPALASGSDAITLQEVKTPDFPGTVGDGHFTLNGFAVTQLGGGNSRLLVVNAGPSVDPTTGTYVPDQTRIGTNATIEIFERRGRSGDDVSFAHMGTVAHLHIATPNRVTAVGDDGFYLTNDHGKVKTGELARMAAMLGKGDVTFCTFAGDCRVVSPGLAYPNGLLMHSDGRLYVPSSSLGGIEVYEPQKNGSLVKLTDIGVFYGIDNLSEDANGDIYAAIHLQGAKMLASTKAPFGPTPPTGVVRIRRDPSVDSGYKWEKVLEDRDGEVLPGTTTVLHDALTGRLFFSGGFSPFITVCDPRKSDDV